MRKSFGFFCFVFCMLVTPGLAEDWQTLLRQSASADSLERKLAQEQVLALVNKLADKPAIDIQPEVENLLALLKGPEQLVHRDAAAILATLSITRKDGAIILGPAVPALLQAFKDSDLGTRRAAVGAIVNLKPSVPTVAVNPLIEVLQESDPQIVGLAAAGLTGFCATSSSSATAIIELLDDQVKSRKLSGIKALSTGSCADAGVLRTLGRNFGNPDKDIVLATVQTVGRIGAPGRVFGPDLERLIATGSDQVIAAAAASALQRLQ